MRAGAEAATQARATALGTLAVLLWSALALLTVGARRLPPFQLLALTFAVAAAMGTVLSMVRRRRPWAEAMRWPAALVLASVALAGYHFSYFVALRNAPAVDASLIAYLWPLLIVVFSGIAHGGLRVSHVAGAALGLAGAWLILASRGAVSFEASYALGYGAAAACALIWSAYSVANRRYASAPVDVVTVACFVTAVFGAGLHVAYEAWAAPTASEWWFIAWLGLGPVGAAFFLWDHGTKKGNLPLLGVVSYAAPVLSTGFLVVAGDAEPTWRLGAAALLVAGGAALASLPRR